MSFSETPKRDKYPCPNFTGWVSKNIEFTGVSQAFLSNSRILPGDWGLGCIRLHHSGEGSRKSYK